MTLRELRDVLDNLTEQQLSNEAQLSDEIGATSIEFDPEVGVFYFK